MKTTDLAFALTLSAMLLGSLTAAGSLGWRTGRPDGADMPVLRMEPVVITGTKSSARAPATTSATVPCAAEAQRG
jgi:hypothetical protein